MEILLGLGLFAEWRGQYDRVQELVQRVLALAEQSKAPATLARVYSQLAGALLFSGQLEEAREHFERALNLFEPGIFGKSSGVEQYELTGAMSFLNVALALLGYPATALRKSREWLDAVRRLSDPVLTARLLVSEARLHNVLRDDQTNIDQSEELFSIATEHGMAFRLVQANFGRGWALAIAGQAQEGVARMRQPSRTSELLAGTSTGRIITLADACLRTRLCAEGLAAVAEGLAGTDRIFDAGLQQIKGELLVIQNRSAQGDAERCFRAGIEIARHQKAWELRATTSLTRLVKRQGKTEEARRLLADIYNWFTEGFEFADLKDAGALLDELDTAAGTR
jgi:tetratricopeptide (TPR) repeat protein